MKFVLLTYVDKQPLVVGTFPTQMAAEIAVATLKISHPDYSGWKIVEVTGIRALKRGDSVRRIRKIS